MVPFEEFQKSIKQFNLPTFEFCHDNCTVTSVPTFIAENKESKFTAVLLSFTQDTHSRLTLNITLKKIRLIHNNNTIIDNPVALVVSGRSYIMANGEIGIKFKTKKEADLIMIFKDVDKGDKIIIEDFIEAELTENSLTDDNKNAKKVTPEATKQIFNDSTVIKIGNINLVGIYTNRDTTKIASGTRELYIAEDGNNISLKRSKTPKFNGHWGGVDLGLNGFFLPDFKTSLPKDLEYFNLRTTKSVVVNVNFYEQNIAFTKNKKLGMVTGLGLSWNNYRFMN